jgi:regulator of nucleoside diphosphate kinase
VSDTRSTLGSVGRERDKDLQRLALVEAAEHVLKTKGYYLTTIEEIARDAGYSVGTLYNLFGSKESLYAEVIEGIGRQLIARLEHTALRKWDPDKAVEELIKIRLYNYHKDRLFFQAFSSEGQLGIQLGSTELPPRVTALYDKYLGSAQGLFKRVLDHEGIVGPNPMHLVLSLEAIIQVFMGYWTRPSQSDSTEQIARHIKEILISPITLQRIGAIHVSNGPCDAERREIHISRFDLERLKELIEVAKCFGSENQQSHLADLESELGNAKVVSPREVPPDLVTMNSVIQLRDLDSGQESVCALVFPRDAESKRENTSILSLLGTALFGARVGDIVTVNERKGAKRHRVEALLYQPEAAGDYHL